MSLLRRIRPTLLHPSRPYPTGVRNLITQPLPPLVQARPLPTNLRSTSEEAKTNHVFMQGLLSNLREIRKTAKAGGGKAVLERWKSRGEGKLGVRERCVC